MPLSFRVSATDVSSSARRGTLNTAHGVVETPAFMTVGTRASVPNLTPSELAGAGCQVVLGNTYHLMLRPGPERFDQVGGIHKFCGWRGPILTDSGGYQVFSLARDCVVSERGAFFKAYTTEQMEMLTPERSIKLQTAIGADIMMALDVCIGSKVEAQAVRQAMDRTHRWALRCLEARTQLLADNPHDQSLFAIVQGGLDLELRRESVDCLTSHAFDGFAIGGVAVGDSRSEREDVVSFSAGLLPADKPRYLMGIGTPPDLLEAMLSGLDLFDCVIPTRLACQGTAFTQFGRTRVTRARYFNSDEPLDPACSCSTCAHFSRSYLHHLFKAGEPLGYRLLSLHNVHYYNQLMAESRTAIEAGRFREFARERLEQIDRHEGGPRFTGGARLESKEPNARL